MLTLCFRWVRYNATSHCYKMYGEEGPQGHWWKQDVLFDRKCPCLRSGFEYRYGMGQDGYDQAEDENDSYSHVPSQVDTSKYFYEAKCEYEYIDGCPKSNPVATGTCPDFETCFQSRHPGLMIQSPFTDGNASKSAVVSFILIIGSLRNTTLSGQEFKINNASIMP